jgi:hypothetical protein
MLEVRNFYHKHKTIFNNFFVFQEFGAVYDGEMFFEEDEPREVDDAREEDEPREEDDLSEEEFVDDPRSNLVTPPPTSAAVAVTESVTVVTPPAASAAVAVTESVTVVTPPAASAVAVIETVTEPPNAVSVVVAAPTTTTAPGTVTKPGTTIEPGTSTTLVSDSVTQTEDNLDNDNTVGDTSEQDDTDSELCEAVHLQKKCNCFPKNPTTFEAEKNSTAKTTAPTTNTNSFVPSPCGSSLSEILDQLMASYASSELLSESIRRIQETASKEKSFDKNASYQYSISAILGNSCHQEPMELDVVSVPPLPPTPMPCPLPPLPNDDNEEEEEEVTVVEDNRSIIYMGQILRSRDETDNLYLTRQHRSRAHYSRSPRHDDEDYRSRSRHDNRVRDETRDETYGSRLRAETHNNRVRDETRDETYGNRPRAETHNNRVRDETYGNRPRAETHNNRVRDETRDETYDSRPRAETHNNRARDYDSSSSIIYLETVQRADRTMEREPGECSSSTESETPAQNQQVLTREASLRKLIRGLLAIREVVS